MWHHDEMCGIVVTACTAHSGWHARHKNSETVKCKHLWAKRRIWASIESSICRYSTTACVPCSFKLGFGVRLQRRGAVEGSGLRRQDRGSQWEVEG